MIEEEALVRAVIADPDDDAPRLIYADWLDEQGQCERAEFIRIQCAIARQTPQAVCPPDLLRREGELLEAHGRAWAGRVRAIATEWVFRRGFIDQATCSGFSLVSRAAELFRTAPVRHLMVRDARRVARDLFWLPQLSNLCSLQMGSNALGDKGAGYLARCSYLKGLLVLNLQNNGIGPSGARSLAVSPYLAGLEMLILSGNSGMRDKGRQVLVRRFGQRVHF